MTKVYTLLVAVGLGVGITFFRDAPALTFAHEVLRPVEVAVSENVYSNAIKNSVTFETDKTIVPKKKDDAVILLPYTFTADAIIAKDVESGALLYEKNAYQEQSLASITKLMSALVLLEKRIDWDAKAIVSADNVPDNHMYAGDTYTRDDLWYAAFVGSSNKAVLSLIDTTGWTREQFIARMNEKALELGMSTVRFEDPTGLSANNVGTASDIAMLLNEALSYEKIRTTLMTSEHTLYSVERNKRHQIYSTNWLLLNWVPHDLQLVGGKTGYIVESGYNFAMEVQNDDGRVIDVVVLGTNSNEARFSEARDIANWAFDSFEWER